VKNKITYRVMKMQEFAGNNPIVFYKLDCSCGDDSHILTFTLDYEMNYISLTMYQNIVWSSYYGSHSIFYRIKERIVNAFKVLFFGYLEGQATLSLNGEEHIQSFINALEEGKGYVKKFEEDFQKKEPANSTNSNEESKG
jgi:hypothetical protein